MRRLRHARLSNPRIQEAVGELQAMIRNRWPDATFEVTRGEDPDGIYIDATVDIDDLDEVMDLVIDRLVQMQVEEGLPVHVIPVWPLERTLEAMRNRPRPTPRPTASPAQSIGTDRDASLSRPRADR